MSTLARRLCSLAALLIIVALLIGLPIVLLAVGANPLAITLPSWDQVTSAFTTPDDGTLALGAIKVVGWLAWLWLAIAILVELVSAARGIQAPKIPGLRLSQGMVRPLVVSAIALFAAAGPVAAATAAPANAAPHAPAPAVVASVDLAAPTMRVANEPHADAVAQPEALSTVAYTVRAGDTLWSIAEQQLGDAHRYRELVDLNAHLLGGKADWLQPGWTLTIPAPTAQSEAGDQDGPRTVVVQKGDTLTSIAKATLGDPGRYGEILDASRDTVQPDGGRLTDPDLIRPGWTLTIPETVVAAATAPAPASAPAPAHVAPAPDHAAVSEHVSAPETEPEPEPAHAEGVAPDDLDRNAPTPVTAPGPTEQDPTTSRADTESAAQAEGLNTAPDWQVVTASGVGTLLAAGVLAVVARRRREQQRLRKPGEAIPLPAPDAAAFEQELRAAADDLGVERIDTALRLLAQQCTDTGQPLPDVRAARLTVDQFELYLATPANLPTPWINVEDAAIWTLPSDAAPMRDLDDPRSVPAPYPALVTIGHDAQAGHVMLNLEHLGALGITGTPDTDTRQILAALIIELATSVWSDDLQVTTVAMFGEMPGPLQSGNVKWRPVLTGLIDQLTTRAAEDREAMAAAGVTDLNAARAARLVTGAWTPEIVVTDGLSDSEGTQLTALVTARPRTAVAAITAGASVSEWTLRTNPEAPTAVLEPIGLEITPQRLPLAEYDKLLEVLSLTRRYELSETGTPIADPTLADLARVRPVAEPAQALSGIPNSILDTLVDQVEAVPHPVDTGAPSVHVLGPVDVRGAADDVEDASRARLVEFAAFLAVHPGAGAAAIDDAMWPSHGGDNTNIRATATSELRRWLGTDPNTGTDYLPRHDGNQDTLSAAVACDVREWDRLLAGEPLAAPNENLEAALRLIRGIPFQGTPRRRYAWAEPDRQRLIAEIIDAAYTLASRRLAEGRWQEAEAAAAVGLHIEPAQEALWRLRILAAHQSANPALEAEAVSRLTTLADRLDIDLEPETERLLAELEDTDGTPGRRHLRAL